MFGTPAKSFFAHNCIKERLQLPNVDVKEQNIAINAMATQKL